MARIGIAGYGSGKGSSLLAMYQALAMGLSVDSIVNAAIPNGPYQPRHFIDEYDSEEIQTKVSAAEAKRQRKNAKRLKDMGRI